MNRSLDVSTCQTSAAVFSSELSRCAFHSHVHAGVQLEQTLYMQLYC